MRDLFFNIRAKDLTGAAFDRVKRGLSTVDGAMAGLGQRADRFGQKLVGLGSVMAGVTGSLVMAFRDSLSLWDTQERAQAKVEQAVRQTGMAAGFAADELFKQASALQAVTRFGDEAILDGVTAQFLTFTNITGEAFERAQESVLDLSTVLNADLKGTAIMLGKALQDPIRGLGALSKAGITFTADQKKVVAALMETGRIAEAQALILDEIQRVYGGQARAAAEVGTGFLIQFQNAWGDLKETVGGVVASLLPPVTNFLMMIADGFQGLSEPMQRAIVAFIGTAAALGVMALAAGAAMIALAPLSLPFIAIAGAIAGAIALCVAFWPEIQKVAKVAREVFLGLQVTVAQGMQATVELVVAGANNYVNSYQGAFDAIKAIWGALPSVIGDLVYSAANALIGGTEAMINGVIARVNAFVSGINSALAKLPEWATGEGGLQVGLVADVNLGRLTNEFEGAMGQAAKDAAGAFQAAFDSSPFEVPDVGLTDWADRAQADLDTLRAVPPVVDETAAAIEGVDAALNPVVPALDATAGAAKGASGGLSGMGKAAATAGDGLGDLLGDLEETEHALSGFGRETSGMFQGLLNPARREFESFGDFALEWGSRFLDRMLTQVFDPLGNALQGFMDNAMQGGLFGGGGAGGGLGGMISGAGSFLSGLLPGFNTGGEMAIGGRAGIDRNVAAFRVSQGETVKVTRKGDGGGGGRPVVVNIQTPNPAAFSASRGRIATDIARAVGNAGRFD